MEERHVVTCVLREGGAVLLLCRSDAVGSYAGRWGAVSGHVADHGDPDSAALAEIREEVGLVAALDADPAADAVLVRRGEPFAVADEDIGVRWVVHPYLFDAASRAVTVDRETTEAAWVAPPEIRRRETVPSLWESYERVAPTVETVRSDREHGSATISVRALEVLRDRAAVAADDEGGADGGWAVLADLAERLRAARPGMAAVRVRIDRAMSRAVDDAAGGGKGVSPEAVERAATAGIEAALAADDAAASVAGELVEGQRVATLSRSGTVLAALRAGDPAAVLVGESRPDCEGVGVAEELAGDGREVTLTTDAALPGLLGDCDAVLVGADAVGPDGAVVNKVGTYPLALAAARVGVPVYVAFARDKVVPAGETGSDGLEAFVAGEVGDPSAVYDGDAEVAVANPLFEVTPADLVTAAVTEDGPLDADEVAGVAAEHRDLAKWRERT